MNLNEFYLEAKRRGIVSNERAHASVRHQTSNGIGLVAKLLVKFDCRDLTGEVSQIHHAYAAVALFDRLPREEYDRIANLAVKLHGVGQKAEMHALQALLGRTEAVLIKRDMKVARLGAPDYVSLIEDMRVFNGDHIEAFSRTLIRADVMTILKDFDADVLQPEKWLGALPAPRKSMGM